MTLAKKMFAYPSSKRWRESLIETGTDDGGWIRHYRDPATDQQWTEYSPYPDDRSPIFMRHRSIPTDLAHLLQTCLSSSEKDEWRGVAAYVSGAFHTVEVANTLETVLPDIRSKSLKTFGRYYRPDDRREIVGMHHSEVERSYVEHTTAVAKINELTKQG